MDILEKLQASQPGYCLDHAFYSDSGLFARDLDLLLARWFCAGHVSDIPASGDYLVAELGTESAIVVRNPDLSIRALSNVCRHRGSRICVTPRGHAASLICPYHAWSYHLDGRLRQAREMPNGFDPAAHGLAPLPVKIIGGLIFISFGDNPPDLSEAAQSLEVMTGSFGWENAKVAARKTYSVNANWKLTLENYHECNHCAPAHPEFAALHALSRPGNRRIGPEDRESWAPIADDREVFRVMHSTLTEGVQTGSRDGTLLAPRMGDPGLDGTCIFGELGYLSAFLAYADYGVVYRFIPRDVLKTEMEVLWLVRGDAVAGKDYDEGALTWLWDVTSQADKTIIERNQAGVLSRAYRPGPFSLMEPGTRQYVERYVADMRRLGS